MTPLSIPGAPSTRPLTPLTPHHSGAQTWHQDAWLPLKTTLATTWCYYISRLSQGTDQVPSSHVGQVSVTCSGQAWSGTSLTKFSVGYPTAAAKILEVGDLPEDQEVRMEWQGMAGNGRKSRWDDASLSVSSIANAAAAWPVGCCSSGGGDRDAVQGHEAEANHHG